MSIAKPRCTHYHACRCPIYAEYAERPLRRDEWSPEWLQKSLDDEDDDKAKLKWQCWRYRAKHFGNHLKYLIFGVVGSESSKPENPTQGRAFRWLMSSHHIAEGYNDGRAPWGMLVRCFFINLPEQLNQEDNARSIKSWRRRPATAKGKLYDRTELDNAPPNITCGRRVVFSPNGNDKDWLIVIYLWATERTWAKKTDVRDLVSFSSVVGIRAWEWVNAVDIPAKIPYLFYELERGRKGRLRDTVFGGLPYRDYDTVPFKPGDPVPDRLSRLRCCMNNQARSLLYADDE
ncbi:hypothetical protein V8C37DRAFT_200363 [Trichoderma ceciliae]